MHKHSFVPQQVEKKSLSIKYKKEKGISISNNTTYNELQLDKINRKKPYYKRWLKVKQVDTKELSSSITSGLILKNLDKFSTACRNASESQKKQKQVLVFVSESSHKTQAALGIFGLRMEAPL